MRHEANTAGLYHSELWNRDPPRIQILSIRDLLVDGKKPALRHSSAVVPAAERIQNQDAV